MEGSIKQMVACNVYFVPPRDPSCHTASRREREREKGKEKGELKMYKYPC